MALPERIPEMVRKGILPLATSLPGPVEWA
jgi:hypothetical protein